MSDSWDRAEEMINFVEGEAQKEEGANDIKHEKCSFNVLIALLGTLQSRAKTIELTLSMIGDCKDEKELKTFQNLLNSIMLNNENVNSISKSLDKIYSCGQAILQVKQKREDNKTLNKVIDIENIEDITSAFFDTCSIDENFNNGRYCGRYYEIEPNVLKKHYKKLANLGEKNNCHVIDCWMRSDELKNYLLLETGEYKREDLINSADFVNKTKPPIKEYSSVITYYRAAKINDEYILLKKTKTKLTQLPMIFHTGGIRWIQKINEKSKYETFPPLWNLLDAQDILNYNASIILSLLKTTSSPLWIFSPEHLQNEEARLYAQKINQMEGAAVFSGDTSTIQKHPPQQMPGELVQLFSQLQTAIRGMSSDYFSENAEKLKATAGVAIKQLSDHMDLSQNKVILSHINIVNVLGRIVKDMIPTCYHQERQICVKKEDGRQEMTTINKKVALDNGMTAINNNIMDLNDKYDYRIKGGISKRIQDENTRVEFEKLYAAYPPAIATTIDIYAQSLDLACSDVHSKRLAINIPEPIVQYGDGDINKQQFQQQQQQMMMHQQQAKMNDPETKLIMAKAQAEVSKAQTAKFKAETERNDTSESYQHNKIKMILDALKTVMDNKTDEKKINSDLAIEALKSQNVMAMEHRNRNA
jgi:hypothetical protein